MRAQTRHVLKKRGQKKMVNQKSGHAWGREDRRMGAGR
jgi:hypothetical protein